MKLVTLNLPGQTQAQKVAQTAAKAAFDAAQAAGASDADTEIARLQAERAGEQQAVAAGLSTAPGSAFASTPASTPAAAQASMLGGPSTSGTSALQAWATTHKQAIEWGVGLAVTALLAIALVKAKHPAP
jgi:hypothetical protein